MENQTSLVEKIQTKYIDYCLLHNRQPENVYQFCKELEMEETAFYANFGSLSAVQKSIWKAFFQNAIMVMRQNEHFAEFTVQDKLSTLFYTIIEVFTMNRSYIMFENENTKGIHKLNFLSEIKADFDRFLQEEQMTDVADVVPERFKKPAEKVNKSLCWLHFNAIVRFWLQDDSAAFEKTDIFIEKSVKAVFEVAQATALKSVFDFGKFLWKEKMMS